MKRIVRSSLLGVFLSGFLHAEPAEKPSAQPAALPVAVPTQASDELASLLRIGAAKIEQRDWDSSEIAFQQVLAAQATPAQYFEALSGLARTYRLKGDLTKACAIYERIVKDYPDEIALPGIYLDLGRTLRALGAYRLALNRFYSVINSTLKLPTEGADHYRQLARTAQFEVAETYFQSGDYAQAYRYFTRLNLLDLAPADRARATFKSAYALTLQNDHAKAVVVLQNFLALPANDENAAEGRYLLSVELRRLGRDQESLAAVLDLLRIEKIRTQTDPKTWIYWQRQTGNQLANEFYEQGDAASALTIYQALLELDTMPTWRLPLLYQIGLCHERLRQQDRARLCYQGILDAVRTQKADPAADKALNFDDLALMAEWRLKSLGWQDSIDHQVSAFFTPAVPAITAPATTPAVSPTP